MVERRDPTAPTNDSPAGAIVAFLAVLAGGGLGVALVLLANGGVR